jgi:hypothetical protein
MARPSPHPFVTEVLELCRSKADVTEVTVPGETFFRARGRTFAFIGRPDRAAVTMKPPREDHQRLLPRPSVRGFLGATIARMRGCAPSVRRARYIGWLWGRWMTVTMRDEQLLRLALDLVDKAYRLAADGPDRRRNDGWRSPSSGPG